VTLDLATHDIDLTRFVLTSEYRQARALRRSRPGRQHEDAIAVLGEMDDGTMVSHLVNWLSPMKERVTVVTGDRGILIADTVFADLTFHQNGASGTTWDELAQFGGVTEGNVVRFALNKVEPLRAEHESFFRFLDGQSGDVCTLEDASRTVAVAEQLLTGSLN
jgi:predicted dehydrogenase